MHRRFFFSNQPHLRSSCPIEAVPRSRRLRAAIQLSSRKILCSCDTILVGIFRTDLQNRVILRSEGTDDDFCLKIKDDNLDDDDLRKKNFE